jgi:glutaminyl-tRNA synthetase
VEEFDAVNNPEDPGAGSRKVPFSREIVIERDDFMENPPKKYFRMTPGQEVRLRWAYIVKCTGVEKDGAGNVVAVRCTYDPATRGGDIPLGPDGKPSRKVQGTIHWVSAAHGVRAEVRLFDRLFTAEEPGKQTGNWADDLNLRSLEVIRDAVLEPSLASARFGGRERTENGCEVGERFQFERLGYFCVDKDSKPGAAGGALVFNRTVTLKDSWGKNQE